MKIIFITMLVALQLMQSAMAQSKKAESQPLAKTTNGS